MVTSTMDQPKLCMKAPLNQLTRRNSGLARIDSQPKSTTWVSFGLMLASRSRSLGPTNSSKRLAPSADSPTATPGNAAAFSSNGVRTVSPNVTTCIGTALPGGRNTAAK